MRRTSVRARRVDARLVLLAALPVVALAAQQPAPDMTVPAGAARVEQTAPGERPAAVLVASFEGLGETFKGPQGTALMRNPSDNSLAVGPNHIVVTVNSRMAIFTKKGKQFDMSGRALYGPVNTNNVFKGFGGQCEALNNGDAVVRYDQLADRWLIVMPLFRRGPVRADQPAEWTATPAAYVSPPGVAGQPGSAAPLFQPPPPDPAAAPPAQGRGGPPAGRGAAPGPQGPYSMCYAISTGPDPFGPYYRYEFLRPLFPDYPRPAVWPDGYYVPTSTGDDVIQKHTCAVDRARMLAGAPATEQCFVVDGVNFLNNADLDGKETPPRGAPNIVIATGGTQLKGVLEDDGLEGEAAQNAMRWEDYTQTAVDPSDDCTIWYVGDYIRTGGTNYSTRIGAFRMPGCG